MSAGDYSVRYFRNGEEQHGLWAMGEDGTFVTPFKLTSFELVHRGCAQYPGDYLQGKKYECGEDKLDWERLRERGILGYRKFLQFKMGPWSLTVKFEDEVQILTLRGPNNTKWVAVSGFNEAVRAYNIDI